MNNDSRLIKVLGTIQAICGWILTVTVGILSIFIAFDSPFRAFLLALMAIVVCPKVDLLDSIRYGLIVVLLMALSISK